jgi:multicomponent Na+:H+ antiporter subunit C
VTRIIIGILLLGNATNLLLLSLAGPPGTPPISGSGVSSDPLPQALILTAIVITFAVSAFLMALVHRSWRLAQEDRLERDEADVAVRRGEQPQPEAPSADEESEFDRPVDER